MIGKQKELYKRTSIERASELAAWLKHEINAMRLRFNAEQLEIRQMEIALQKVQDILFDLKQDELF
ncbi:hypothetical protein Holit_01764 [Hollandina sp. SP2]